LIVLADHFRKRTVLGFIAVQRPEVLLDFLFEALSFVPGNFRSECFLGNLRGVDRQTFRLRVQIRIDRDADGLLGGFEVVEAKANEVKSLPWRKVGVPVLKTLVKDGSRGQSWSARQKATHLLHRKGLIIKALEQIALTFP
jgi:hypothetical protein